MTGIFPLTKLINPTCKIESRLEKDMIQNLIEQLDRVSDMLDETDTMIDAAKEAYASGEINVEDLDALAGATWGHLIPIIMGDDFIPL